MDAGKPKKKRSELELLLGNGDAGGFAPFSPRLPAVSISSPAMADATAESDEALARRLHEELNGTRATRRGSRAVTEDTLPLSPTARGMASPQPKPKVDTPRGHGGQARTSLPSLSSVPVPATTAGGGDGSATMLTEAASGEAGRTAVVSNAAGAGSGRSTTGGAAGGRSGSGDGSAPNPAADGTTEAVKRKRNSVPARELHLLLQQAASSAGRNESALSPTRSTRGSAFGSGRVDMASGAGGDAQQQHSQHHATHGNQQGTQAAQRRDAEPSSGQQAQQGQPPQHQPAGSAMSAPMAAPPSPRVPLPPPCPPSLLPPKLKQRYLAGRGSLHQAAPGSASASVSNTGSRADGVTAGGATGQAPTTVTPSCNLSGARNSLLSGHSIEGSSTQSHTQSPSWAREGSGTGAYGGPEALLGAAAAAAASAASLAGATARPQVVAGATAASVGGCSSTDETETDNDNSGSAAATGAAEGGPSATSPKALLGQPQQQPPPLQVTGTAAQKQRQAQADGGAVPRAPKYSEDERSSQGKQPRQSGSRDAAVAAAEPPPASAKTKQGSSASGPLKVPKLPMIRAGRGWYRGRLLRESQDGERVLVDVPGAPAQPDDATGSNSDHNLYQHLWLPAASDRIWRGSYKGKDWKYLGDGAWEPKPGAFKRGKLGSSSNGLPLPLPQWAVGGVGAGSVGAETGEADGQQPSGASVEATVAAGTGGAGSGGDAGASRKQRPKRHRSGWSSPEEEEDEDISEEADEEQERRHRSGLEKPSSQQVQRSHRRSSPPAAAIAASTAAAVGAVSGLGSACTGKAGAVPATPAPAATDGVGGDAAESDVEAGDVAGGQAAQTADDAVQVEGRTATVATADTIDGRADGGEAKPASGGSGVTWPEASGSGMPSAARAPALETGAAPVDPAPGLAQDGDVGINASDDGVRCGAAAGSGAPVSAPVGAATKLTVAQSDSADGAGDGKGEGQTGVAEGDSDGDIKWAPGVPYPRARRPRRAQRRQQRVRTPFDGMQFPLAHHHSQHNPYSFYPGLSGEESGGDGDSSDLDHGGGVGGRRGSDGNGDGTAAHHQSSRRRAAARAAAVAAAAARAEAEAEEEEQEEILLGRRPPRRDKFNTHSGQQAGANRRGSHHRSRSSARADDYLYGDSSGNLDDPYGMDASAPHGNVSSARPRAGSRGNSQPAPEPYGSGGSGAWETTQWQGDRSGAGQAPQQPRNRRKGKPSRSRMDGEGDVWCWEDDWELEAAGGTWARMPEVLRRLYYAPGPAADDGSGSLANAGQRTSAAGDVCRGVPHRQSGGGAYFGALQGPNKRRRVYDEDPAISPDDVDLEMEVDDHEHDADYLPPYGAAGAGRRGSGFGGGRRCSANGGGAATKRHRSGDGAIHYQASSSYFQQHQMGQYGDTAAAAAPPPRRRILVSCGWGLGSTATAAAGGGAMTRGPSGSGAIPSGLAGLLEAALGLDADAPAAAAATTNAADTDVHAQPDGARGPAAGDEVKKEPGSEQAAAEAAAGLHVVAAAVLQVGCAAPSALPGDPLGAHVALSDSSAAPSGLEEGKLCAGSDATAAAGVATVGTAIDASGYRTCADVGAGGLSQQLVLHGGGGGGGSCGGAAAGGSPTPPGQLRPNTPTRAKRTGRPPSAGAPLPKLPALSSTASLRLQMAGLGGPGGSLPAPPAAAAAGQIAGVASGTSVLATTTDALLSPRVSLGPEAPQLRGEEAGGRPVGQGGLPSADAADEGPRGDVVRSLWHAVGGSGGAAQPGDGGRLPPAGEMDGMDAALRNEATCPGTSAFTTTAAVDVLAPGAKRPRAAAAGYDDDDGGGGACVGSGCCVMDAIGALLYDQQPAMQQLAMRAQLELDTIGQVLASQHPYHPQFRDAGVQDEPRLPSSRAGCSGRGAGLARSGSMSGAMSPAAPDPFIASLPSVEVVVSLFSARTPYGSPQQALADLVGGAASLPLFR